MTDLDARCRGTASEVAEADEIVKSLRQAHGGEVAANQHHTFIATVARCHRVRLGWIDSST